MKSARPMIVAALVAGWSLALVPAVRAHVEFEASLDTVQATPRPAPYYALLDAAQEVPAPTVGSPSPTGTATLTLNADKTLTYTVTVHDLSGAAVAAHVHQGAAGVAGGVVVSLDQATLTGTTAALTDDQVTALNAGGLYVNVHTMANAGGEIRGQISRLAATATATFTLDQEAKTLAYTITPQGLSGTVLFAHLHQGAPGVAGGVKVPLDNSLTGTATLTDDVIATLLDGGLYANVHTTLNPGGEIRGQVEVDSTERCSCKTLTRKAFLACVHDKVKVLSKDDKKSAPVKALLRAVKLSACGKKKTPKKAIACCLPQTPAENIVVGKLCAAVPEAACPKKGGTSQGAGSTCLPDNPCSPPASPSGAFLDGLEGAAL